MSCPVTKVNADSFAGQLAERNPRVPLHTIEGIASYLEHRIPPGDFIRAVLENNLVQAFCKADRYNTDAMQAIAGLVYNDLPLTCWGSPEKVSRWLARTEGE